MGLFDVDPTDPAYQSSEERAAIDRQVEAREQVSAGNQVRSEQEANRTQQAADARASLKRNPVI